MARSPKDLEVSDWIVPRN